MKYLIIIAILSLSIAEKTKCSTDSKKVEMCAEIYIPVCAYSEDGQIVGTFSNECFACKDSKVASFDQVACVAEAVSSPVSGGSSSSSTSSVFKCDIPKSDNPICPAIYKPTCGLFNQNIQCIKAPCGQSFGNECEACSNSNVDSYFYGDCSEQPSETPSNDDEFVKCTDPRPEMCTMEYTDTCAFTEFPCYSDSCQKSAGNHCSACSDSKVIGYLPMKCQDYAVIYTSNQGQEDLSNSTVSKLQCSMTRPTNCDDVVSKVCAQLSCNGTNCEQEFTNECLACSNSAVTSYYKGQCQTSYGAILGLAIFILSL